MVPGDQGYRALRQVGGSESQAGPDRWQWSAVAHLGCDYLCASVLGRTLSWTVPDSPVRAGGGEEVFGEAASSSTLSTGGSFFALGPGSAQHLHVSVWALGGQNEREGAGCGVTASPGWVPFH